MRILGALVLLAGASPAIERGDEDFARKAAEAGVAEVQLGRLAVARAVTPEARAYGQRMIDDHTLADDELRAIAQRKGLTLPTQPNKKQKQAYDELSQLAGPSFDRFFTGRMNADHDEAVVLFEREARDGQDPDLKAYAQKTLPMLRAHERRAEHLPPP